jgi:hypothetical protein
LSVGKKNVQALHAGLCPGPHIDKLASGARLVTNQRSGNTNSIMSMDAYLTLYTFLVSSSVIMFCRQSQYHAIPFFETFLDDYLKN